MDLARIHNILAHIVVPHIDLIVSVLLTMKFLEMYHIMTHKKPSLRVRARFMNRQVTPEDRDD